MRCFYVWYIQKYGCLMSKKCRVNRFRPDGGKRGIISATLFLSRPPLLKKYDLLQMWQEGRIPFFCVKNGVRTPCTCPCRYFDNAG